jgi:hypothetical protein
MSGVDPTTAIREHVVPFLEGRGAHATFDHIFADFPEGLRGVRPAGFDHTAWRLLEHLRIAQKDILEFSRDESWRSPDFPAGYWPPEDAPPTPAAWDESLAAFGADLAAMRALVRDPTTDLWAKIPWGEGQTVLREALLVADHNAYHLAQVVDLRKALGAWPPAK